MTITLVKGHEPVLYGALKYCWSFLQNLQCKLERTIIIKLLKKVLFTRKTLTTQRSRTTLLQSWTSMTVDIYESNAS